MPFSALFHANVQASSTPRHPGYFRVAVGHLSRDLQDVPEGIRMKAAHGGEVVGEGVGVSRLQLLNQQLDIGGDEFLFGGGLFFAVDGVTLGVVAALLMVLSPLRLLLLFMPCVACTYMPNASWRRRGGKAQGEGYLPSGAKRRTSEAKVCTSAARKTVGKPLALRQGSALSEVWFPYSCA